MTNLNDSIFYNFDREIINISFSTSIEPGSEPDDVNMDKPILHNTTNNEDSGKTTSLCLFVPNNDDGWVDVTNYDPWPVLTIPNQNYCFGILDKNWPSSFPQWPSAY